MVDSLDYTVGPAIRGAQRSGEDGDRAGLWDGFALTLDQLLAMPPRRSWLGGLIAPGEVTVLFGSPKAGKSALALSVAYQLAVGRPLVHGYEAEKLSVLYVAAEGGGDFRSRVELLRRKYGDASGFRARLQAIALLDPHSPEVSNLIERMRTSGTKLLVLDTLARMMSGGDENSSKDMGAVNTSLGRIMAETGAAVLVVHHDRKGNAGRITGADLRGHGNLQAAVDTIVHVRKLASGMRVAEILEGRAVPEGLWLGYRLVACPIEFASDGKTPTAVIVDDVTEDGVALFLGRGAERHGHRNDRARGSGQDTTDEQVLAMMRAVAADSPDADDLPVGTMSLSKSQANRIVDELHPMSKPAARRQVRTRFLKRAAHRNLLRVEGSWVHLFPVQEA
jgi:KaiC/GvpD/RAD55 family RecA-like ATPase